MNTKKPSADLIIRWGVVILSEILTLLTLINIASDASLSALLLCIATFLLIFIPAIAEKVFSCRICTPLYVVCVIYAIGPMLGNCYSLYYTTAFWDKLLHTLGGVVFAMFGDFLFDKMIGGKKILPRALFALCFSVALSVAWEFVEFGCDVFLHTDMQRDTIINALHSYDLGAEVGKVGHVEDIGTVLIDGTEVFSGGYLDIGLIDSMTDMLLETLGAAAFCAARLIDKGKHVLFAPTAKKEAKV